MHKIEVHHRINQVTELIYRSGFWDKDDDSTVRIIGKKIFFLIFLMLFGLSLAVGAWTNDDKNESIFLTVAAIQDMVLTIRLFYIIRKQKEICGFLRYFGVHSIENNEEFTEVDAKLKSFFKFVKYFVSMIFIAPIIIVNCVLPFVLGERQLGLNIWFPLDYKNNWLGYCIAYAFVLCGCLLCFVASLLIVIIWYLLFSCAIKYKILGNQFRNLGGAAINGVEVKKPKITEKEKENLFFRDLVAGIKSHREIKESTEQFKSSFSKVFLIQLATGALGLCGSVYALVFTSLENIVQYVVYTTVLLYVVFDIFMVMYLGNEIQLASDRLSYCLFESNWIGQSKSCRKCIVIMMEVLKQPQVLVIWKLYPLNLETFVRILHGAYSMFNILQNLK